MSKSNVNTRDDLIEQAKRLVSKELVHLSSLSDLAGTLVDLCDIGDQEYAGVFHIIMRNTQESVAKMGELEKLLDQAAT